MEDEAAGREAGTRWYEQISQSRDWAEGRAAFSEKQGVRFEGR